MPEIAWPLQVKAIPRVTSKGALCGAVYRVASRPNLEGGVAPDVHV